jgi:hypothetical protein
MVWLIVVLAIVVVAVVGVVAYDRGRSAALRRRFGTEYDRVVEARDGDRRGAEAELRELARKRDALDVKPLPPEVRRAYAERWRGVQARFVDDPSGAVGAADDLLVDVLRERGYPVDDRDERVAFVATDHPDAVADYRKAHDLRHSDGWGSASTDDLRTAFLGFRGVFERLVGDDDQDGTEAVPARDVTSPAVDADRDGEPDGKPSRTNMLTDPARRRSIDRRVRQVRGNRRAAGAG